MQNDRFSLDDTDGWRSFLHEHGYAVVSGVLTPAQVAAAMDDLWSIMESLGTVRRSQPQTWTASARWPPMLHGGMIQYLGHTPLQWRLREQVTPLFSRYYSVPADRLATSFDGLCMMHGARSYQARGEWLSFLHTDQSPRRKGEWSIQGLVNLADAGPKDGGLVVVPGTHLEHVAFFAQHANKDQASDWYKFSAEEAARYRSRAVKVCGEPGDMMLWDSRTFHCNTVPERQDAIRACAYVCMLPRQRVGAAIRQKRRAAWEGLRTSSHHPAEGFRTFPTLPRFVTDRDAFLARCRALQQGTALTPLQTALLCAE